MMREPRVPDKPHIVIIAKGGKLWTGGRQYTINLLEALTRFQLINCGLQAAFDVSVLVNEKEELEHYERLRNRLRVCSDTNDVQERYSLASRIRWRIKRDVFGWYNPRLEEALIRLGATFVYPNRASQVRSAEWIPDFQYKHIPEGSNAAEIEGRKHEFLEIIRRSRRIVLSSTCAERDCHEAFPQSLGRTAVLRFRAFADASWLKADPIETVRRYHLPRRFLLISNQLAPTKNHCAVLDALATLSAAERSQLHIVCTGDVHDYRNPGFYNGFFAKIHHLGLHDSVSILGLIPKHDQIQLLRASLGYLQPSLFEGWNTGVEEAHMLGKRIILSDIPVHREQSPPFATFFDPVNIHELSDRIRDFTSITGPTFDLRSEQNALQAYTNHQYEYSRQFLKLAMPVHETLL